MQVYAILKKDAEIKNVTGIGVGLSWAVTIAINNVHY